ncbi:MAG: HlyD family efflux transporter periplasmic adaptor subunit, partial [Chitinophagaceae bacterium]
MKKFIILLLHGFLTGFVVSCGSDTASKKTEVTEEHTEENENGNTASLTLAQINSIGIAFGTIEDKELTASLQANGILQVPNQNKATVNSLYNGVIKSLAVQPGNVVRRGQVIATIANPEFVQVQSDYLNVNARITMAELEVKRQRELNAGNAGALKNLQAAETELRTLRTARATYAQQIKLMGVNPGSISNGKLASVLAITSPINGVVSKVNVEMG